MNFEEMQLVWDTQKERRLFAFDQAAMERVVAREARAIRLDLKTLELSFIVVVVVLAVGATLDTLLQRGEYFQLFGAAVGLTAAGWVWRRRTQRANREEAARRQAGLAGEIELALVRVRAALQASRDMAIYFTITILLGVGVRIAIYDFASSETKLILGLVGIVFLNTTLAWERNHIHRPRLQNLEALRAKLDE